MVIIHWLVPHNIKQTGPQASIFHVLGYLKNSNAAEYAVDSDIFYAVIHLPSKTCTLIFISHGSFKL